MKYPVRSAALTALCAFPFAATAYQTVEDSPNMLDDCAACPTMYNVFFECQQLVGDARPCVCPDSVNTEWYAYIDACQGCLRLSSRDDFWTYFTTTSFALLHSCRAPSVPITADGHSLCTTSGKSESCVSLRDTSQGASWASYEHLEYPQNNKNVSLSLNLAVAKPALTTSTTAASSTTSTPATTAESTSKDTASTTSASEADATGTDSEGTTTTFSTILSNTPSSTSTPTSGTDSEETTSAADAQNTTPVIVPGAAARFGGSSMGWALGMVMVAAFGLL
ncbi:hypothetical protein VTJ49DRAFT_1278 [Mycothermus thermophilus]|uniref:Uncharacterized protein n=1 Tax=Humicola insolens TaxID=85995 RepID=A0ABR3VDA1_HUMIN